MPRYLRAAPITSVILAVILLFSLFIIQTPLAQAQAQTGLTARQGDSLDFTVTVSNSGVVTATAVTVTDPLDVSLGIPTAISNGGTYNAANRTITWTALIIPAASGSTPGQLLLTFNAPVKTGVANGTVIHNTATISPPAEGGPGSVVSSPPVTVLTPDLSTSTKTVTGQVGPGNNTKSGDNLTYSVNIINTGTIPATAVTVTDPVDVSLGTPSAISNGGTYNAANRTITWTWLTIPAASGSTPGQLAVTFQTVVNSGLTAGTVISNQAHISPPKEGGVVGDPKAPDLTINSPNLSTSTKTVAGQAGPGNNTKSGDLLTYTVNIINSGIVTATGVTINDPLNLNLGIPSAISNGGTYTAANRTITWTGLTIGAATSSGNGQLAVTFQTVVNSGLSDGTVISNQAHILAPKEGGAGGDPKAPDLLYYSPNLSTSTKGVSGQSGPDKNTKPGDNLTYTVNIINSGVSTATGVKVTDVMDANLDDPTAISNGGTYDSASRTIIWTGLTIPGAGGNGVGQLALTFQAKVKAASPTGTKVNNSALISPPLEGGPGATVSAPELVVDIPTIQFKKTVTGVGQGSGGGQLIPGSTAEYTVRLTNPNSTSLTNLVFTDGYTYKTGNWPNMQGTTWVGNSASLALEPTSGTPLSITSQPVDGKAEGNLVITVGELLPNQMLIVKFRVKLSASAADIKDGAISNQAYTTSDEVKNIVALGGKLPSDDPNTQAVNDPTISRVVTATASPTPSPTVGPIPALTGRDGVQVNSAPAQDGGLPLPLLLSAAGLLLSGTLAGGFYFWRIRFRK